jgi:5-formyltetrahydrofolate cyclo-ligase
MLCDMHIQEEKQNLRLSVKERILRMKPEELAAEGRSLTRRILEALPPPPITICAYYPLKDEANTSALLAELLRRGDHVFLPRFRDGALMFVALTDLATLSPGALGIPEPPPDAAPLQESHLDIVIVPGRAFDAKGYRIGRGNGGYDKWISKQRLINPSTQYWAAALDCQIVREVPHEPHDEKMDKVITARGPLAPKAAQ